MQKRKYVLEKLIELENPSELNHWVKELSKFKWDSDIELVNLRGRHIADKLDKYLKGSLSKDDVLKWAEAVEVRDDIDFGNDCDEFTLDLVFALATPECEGELTPERAQKMIEEISQSDSF